MAQRERHDPKRVAAVVWLAEEHPDALTAELLRYGLHLTGPYHNCTVDEAYAIAVNTAPGSPLAAALDPAAAWPTSAYLLSSIEYSLRWLCWAKTADGAKGRNRPTPLATPATPSQKKRAEHPGMSKDELAEYLAMPRVELQAVTHSVNP